MLGEVGIEITIDATDFVTLNDLMWPGYNVANGRDFDMGFFAWSPLVNIRAGRYGGLVHSDPARGILNLGGFSNPETDELVAQLDASLTLQERLEAIQLIAEDIAELVPFITLYFPNETYAFRHEVFDGWEVRKDSDRSTRTHLSTTTTSDRLVNGDPQLWVPVGRIRRHEPGRFSLSVEQVGLGGLLREAGPDSA
jgi:ABC-type transport system substrate-binding protein